MKKLVEVHPRNNKQNDSESESEGIIHNLTSPSENIASERDTDQLACYRNWERSGSVVECLTRDRGTTGSSLTGVTALCP